MCAENVWTLLISSFLTFWFLCLSQTFLFIWGTNGFHDSILKATERGIFCFNMYLFIWLHQVLVAWHRLLSSCCCRLSSCGLWPWLPHNTWTLFPMPAWVLSCFSQVWQFATPWTVAHQAPLSMGFSRQEYWRGLPCPPPGHLPDPGIEPEPLASPTLADRLFTPVRPGKPPALRPGIKLEFPALWGGRLTTVPPRKSWEQSFK